MTMNYTELDLSNEGLIDWTLDFFTSKVSDTKLQQLLTTVKSIKELPNIDFSHKELSNNDKYPVEVFHLLMKGGKFVSNPDSAIKEDYNQLNTFKSVLESNVKLLEELTKITDIDQQEEKIINEYNPNSLKKLANMDFLGNCTIRLNTLTKFLGGAANKAKSNFKHRFQTPNDLFIYTEDTDRTLINTLVKDPIRFYQSKRYESTITQYNRSLFLVKDSFISELRKIGNLFQDIHDLLEVVLKLYSKLKSSKSSEVRAYLRLLHLLSNTAVKVAKDYQANCKAIIRLQEI